MATFCWLARTLFCGIFLQINGYITYIAIRLPLQGNRSQPGSPWPQPLVMTTSSNVMTLDTLKFRFTSNMDDCDIIKSAITRYQYILSLDKDFHVDSRLAEIKSLRIDIKNNTCPGYPQLDMNESYSLTVHETSVITSDSVWGALRGLETFSQLVYISDDKTIHINQTIIEDKPRFKHRGIMLDTSRHFLPMWTLLKNLDAMAYNKMNVFHWHIVDDQSFPYQSKRFPDLSAKGAYSSKHVYSPADVKLIIDEARLRGIRVIPEFDTPGHTQSWGKAIKNLLTPCWENGKPGVANYSFHGEYEIVNPTLNSTYEFLTDFFREIVEVFPDKFMHLGMDESYHSCWATNPNISAFMKQIGLKEKDYSALEQYYVENVFKIVQNLYRNYIIWQDPIDHGAKVQQDAIIEVWKGGQGTVGSWQSYMLNITSQGHQAILSTCWYLNYISYGQDWRKYYECDPLDFPGTDDNFKLVIGGEACIWAEYVDHTNVISRLWPRASTAAERLWTDNSRIQDTDSAAFRLDQHRCRLIKRGIEAEPILDGYCGEYELNEDLYFKSPQSPTESPCRITSSAKIVFSPHMLIIFLVALLVV